MTLGLAIAVNEHSALAHQGTPTISESPTRRTDMAKTLILCLLLSLVVHNAALVIQQSKLGRRQLLAATGSLLTFGIAPAHAEFPGSIRKADEAKVQEGRVTPGATGNGVPGVTRLSLSAIQPDRCHTDFCCNLTCAGRTHSSPACLR